MHLFAYGTLMDADIMGRVAGCTVRSEAVLLPDYQRYCLHGETFPGMIAEQGAQVKGVLYHDVPHAAWQRLDDFEGELYRRETVAVLLQDNKQLVTAMTYLIRQEFRHLLSDQVWEYARFLRAGKKTFVARHLG